MTGGHAALGSENEAFPRLHPYVRFLLRRGERRGRLLAALVPSAFFTAPPLVSLVDLLLRTSGQDAPASRGQLTGITILIAVGIVGATVNALVLWRRSAANGPGGAGWVLGLSVPLAVVLCVSFAGFHAVSPGGSFTWVRVILTFTFLAAGYIALNPLSALWPSYRQYAPLFHRSAQITND